MTVRRLWLTTAVLAIGMSAWLAAQKVQMKDLPAAVQKGVQDNLKGATLKSLSKEKERGKTTYEVESTLNGKTYELGPGSVIFQASNEMHGIRNIGKTPAEAAIAAALTPFMNSRRSVHSPHSGQRTLRCSLIARSSFGEKRTLNYQAGTAPAWGRLLEGMRMISGNGGSVTKKSAAEPG